MRGDTIHYMYEGEWLTLGAIARLRGVAVTTAQSRRKNNPGLGWEEYCKPAQRHCKLIVDGKKTTYKDIARIAKISVHTARTRFFRYERGEISGAEVFSQDHLSTPHGKNGGNDEWKNMSTKDRSHNLKKEVGTWESKHIPEPSGYKPVRNYNLESEQETKALHYSGQFRFGGL